MLKEQELTTQLANRLSTLLPPDFTVGSLRKDTRINKADRADILATINTPNKVLTFVIEAKSADRVATMRQAAYQVKRYAQSTNAIPMVATWFLGERTRQAMKEEGVGYIDLAGNFYINQPNIYAEKVVDKNPFSRKLPLKNIFGPTSSRITRALLTEPKREWSISALSREADVSIGQTYNVLEAMAGEELVTKSLKGKWTVSNPASLLEAWKKVYPTYETQRFSFYSYEQNYNILATLLKKSRGVAPFASGFFTGAGFVAPFIRGLSKAQLYVRSREDVEKLQTALGLQPVDSGPNVEIFVPYDQGVFYKQQTVQDTQLGEVPVVSNVQLYMDVFNNPARGEEQAEHLRERKLRY